MSTVVERLRAHRAGCPTCERWVRERFDRMIRWAGGEDDESAPAPHWNPCDAGRALYEAALAEHRGRQRRGLQ